MRAVRPHFIEFHDAEVEGIELRTAGLVILVFAHLPVYLREGPGRCGVWSMRARLECAEVTRIDIDGGTIPAGLVSEATFEDGRTRVAIDPTALLDGVAVAVMRLVWAPSGGLLVGAMKMRLKLGDGERFETYEGEI
jgi:hypothetical protein